MNHSRPEFFKDYALLPFFPESHNFLEKKTYTHDTRWYIMSCIFVTQFGIYRKNQVDDDESILRDWTWVAVFAAAAVVWVVKSARNIIEI